VMFRREDLMENYERGLQDEDKKEQMYAVG
jgi:hypothetical protein